MSDQAFHFCILFSLIYIERLGCVRGPQIQEGAQACHVNRRSQASVEEEVMKDRPAVSLEVNRG